MDTTVLSLASGLIALIVFGVANSLVKIPCKKITSEHFIVWKNIFTSGFLLLVLLFSYKTQNFFLPQIGFSVVIAFLGFLGMALFYKAMEVGKVGIVSPISSTSVIYTVGLSIIFLGAKANPYQLLAISLILLGVFFIRFDPRDFKNSFTSHHIAGFDLAMANAIVMGLYLFLGQIPNKSLGFVLYPFIGETMMLFIGLGYLKYKGERLKIPDHGTIIIMGLAGLFLTIGIFALFFGLKYGNPVIVFPLYVSSSLVVALTGRFFYKEKLQRHQYGAIIAIIAGIMLLRIFF